MCLMVTLGTTAATMINSEPSTFVLLLALMCLIGSGVMIICEREPL